MDTRLDFRILGPLELTAAEEPLPLGGPQQRALLAVLLLNANRVVSRERIVDALWGDEPPRTASNAVQVAVHGLRKLLGRERLQTRGTGYRLEVEPGELDLGRFVESTARARAEDPADAARTLREALSLRRGDPLADFETPFFRIERERIEELLLGALERRIDADLELGRSSDVVPELEALVAAHPYREKLRGQLMLALYRSGRQADALDAYRQARQTLVDALGVEPSPGLQALETAILRQDAALDVVPTAVPGVSARPSLPTPANPLVGRKLDVAAVTALVRTPSTRLVTLTGPGGTGKTRLALEAAHELDHDFAGGVVLVDLTPLRDPALVETTVAHAVGVSDEADTDLAERIAAAIGGRETLLVTDNFEHVLDAAPFVARLVAHVPELRVLATSREPLRIGAEHEYRVPPLALPPAGATTEDVAQADAVALFVARARSAQAEFELTGDNADAVVDICHALDGLPLALELAAARVRLLSTSELRDRIENRLGLLADGPRDLPARQRTLRSTIDWSYDLLDEGEQMLLARLAVFAGGWTLEAAEGVCDAGISTLGSLVEKSLLRSRQEIGAGTRFSMLETVREYALERLTASGELDAMRGRHASYYGDLAVRLQPTLESPTAVDEAEREHDNIRVALEHTLSCADGETALRLCMIARLWYAHGYLAEGSAWIERALALEGAEPVIRARVLYYGSAIAWSSGDYERAVAYGREGLRLAREVDDVMAETGALMALGLAYQGTRDLETARDFYRQSLECARSSGDDRWTAVALVNIADIEVSFGNHEEAEELLREGLGIHRRIGEVEGAGVALLVLASSLLDRGRDVEAAPLIVESLHCFRRVGYKDFLVSALVALARALTAEDPAQAARLLGAAHTLRAPLGPAQFLWEQDWYEATEERVRGLLGPRTDSELTAGARAPGEVVDEVLALSVPAS